MWRRKENIQQKRCLRRKLGPVSTIAMRAIKIMTGNPMIEPSLNSVDLVIGALFMIIILASPTSILHIH
jgi:hypothetical protein